MHTAKGRGPAIRAPKVTQADLARAADFLKAVGARVAAVDVLPGQIKIVTTDGRAMTGDEDEISLDQELESYRSRSRGAGPA